MATRGLWSTNCTRVVPFGCGEGGWSFLPQPPSPLLPTVEHRLDPDAHLLDLCRTNPHGEWGSSNRTPPKPLDSKEQPGYHIPAATGWVYSAWEHSYLGRRSRLSSKATFISEMPLRTHKGPRRTTHIEPSLQGGLLHHACCMPTPLEDLDLHGFLSVIPSPEENKKYSTPIKGQLFLFFQERIALRVAL